MSRWKAVVFDLDDTLYPERDYVFSGFQAVTIWAQVHLGIPARQGFDELRHLFEAGVRGCTFNRWLAMHSLVDESLVQELVHVYREHDPILAPFPEVPNLLASLREHYRLGLVSDGYLSVQQRKWTALGLSCYFDAVVFSDEWGRAAWKPSIKPFQCALGQLGVGAANSMYVADNPAKDFLGARRVGMFTVWVQRPMGEYAHQSPPTPQHAPHLVLTSLVELERLLTDWG